MRKDLAIPMLLDFYGAMLTAKQRETAEYYFEEDLSLGEIAELQGVTRQAVMRCVSQSAAKLRKLETDLSLIRRMRELQEDIGELEELISKCEPKNERVMGDIEEKIVEIKQKL